MSIDRIKGILLQEFYITKRSLEVIMDLFFLSFITAIVFGFVSVFLTTSVSSVAASFLLLGILLMEIMRINQYSMSVGALWNVWSRNLSNMFVAPLSLKEYIVAQIISGSVKSLFTFLGISLLAAIIFDFNIFSVGAGNLSLYFVNLSIFAWTVGIVILGFIFKLGTRIQALAWGLIYLFQPLSAAFFPVEILPTFLQAIAYSLPPTYVFEAARENLSDPSINWNLLGVSFTLNIIYFSLSIWFFNVMFRRSKDSGQFARLEG